MNSKIPTQKRLKYPTCTVYLCGPEQLAIARSRLANVPLDATNPLELVIREKVKVRGLDANARMWVGPLADLAAQAYISGRTYSAEVWHEYLKKEFLPEEYDDELTKDGYRKWDIDPAGGRVLVGSTTQLTVKGFAIYLEQIHAFGANLGVQFSASPRERMAA